MNSSIPYFILRPVASISELPEHILQYAETIRSASTWAALGFAVKQDSDGIPSPESSRDYVFFRILDSDPMTIDAITTGKKAVRIQMRVFEYILAGCDLTDFAGLPEDVKAFCRSNLLRGNGKPEQALPLQERPVKLDPYDEKFAQGYFDLHF